MYSKILKELTLKEQYKNREFEIILTYELLKSKEHSLNIFIYELIDEKTGRSEKVSEFNATEYLQYPNVYQGKKHNQNESISSIAFMIRDVIAQIVDSDIRKEEEIKMLEQLEKEW